MDCSCTQKKIAIALASNRIMLAPELHGATELQKPKKLSMPVDELLEGSRCTSPRLTVHCCRDPDARHGTA